VSNYPPGVTGREYEIAGPDYEREARHHCDHCDEETAGLEQGYDGRRWFVCDTCDEVTDLETDDDDYYDDEDDDDRRYG